MNFWPTSHRAEDSARYQMIPRFEEKHRSKVRVRLSAQTTLAAAILMSATACGIQPVASVSEPSATRTTTAAPAPKITHTAPPSSACTTEDATEKYPPTVFVCTMSDAGKLTWMEQSASKKVTDTRAAALAAKAAADERAQQEAAAAARAAQEEAAAEAARQQAAAAEAARQQAAARVQAPVRPVVPAVSPGCDSNYAGACVPIASDVDCAGGSGNGPAYVRGPVTVVGSDIYGLDRDGNGVGCE